VARRVVVVGATVTGGTALAKRAMNGDRSLISRPTPPPTCGRSRGDPRPGRAGDTGTGRRQPNLCRRSAPNLLHRSADVTVTRKAIRHMPASSRNTPDEARILRFL